MLDSEIDVKLMCDWLDNAVTLSRAEWLLELSDRAKANGDQQRAEALLLEAWIAYDEPEVPSKLCEAPPNARRPDLEAA